MNYSYTQISQYLVCPRRYRHHYLDGWQEKDTRAAMLFGRAFERALAALFRREDALAVLLREWSICRNQDLQYSNGDSWDRMLQRGLKLLDRFCQDLTPSDAWTAHAACLSGRPPPAATLKNRMACLLWIPNSFATPGSQALQRWRRWFSSASDWLKFSTCVRLSLTNSARNSASWSKTPSGGSSRPTSCRTVASASPRTLVPVVRISACASDDRIWSSSP